MNNFSDLSNYSNQFDRKVTEVMTNKYLTGFLTLFGILYISLARPQLPSYINDLFNYPIFKFLLLVLTAYIATKNLKVALIISLVFVVTLNLLNEQKIAEGFISGTIEKYQNNDAKEIESLATDSTVDN